MRRCATTGFSPHNTESTPQAFAKPSREILGTHPEACRHSWANLLWRLHTMKSCSGQLESEPGAWLAVRCGRLRRAIFGSSVSGRGNACSAAGLGHVRRGLLRSSGVYFLVIGDRMSSSNTVQYRSGCAPLTTSPHQMHAAVLRSLLTDSALLVAAAAFPTSSQSLTNASSLLHGGDEGG